MNREAEYLLHLLGAYLREEEPQIREDVNWAALLRLAQIHSVTGIVGYMSMSWPICQDAQMKAALRGVCRDTIGLFAQRAALADAFSARLVDAGIDHILMKGYVLRSLYPVPELRTFSDIDLVIRPEDREKCHRLMLGQGYQVKTDWEPVFSYLKDCEYYEIHADIMEVDVSEKADYQGYFRQMWAFAQPMEEHCYYFRPEFHFLYLLTHIAKHVTGSGAGVRMYLDVAAFVKYYAKTLDWDFVAQELEKLRLADFANVVLTLVEKEFGVESPLTLQPVEETVWKTFIEFTVDGGIFGRNGKDSGTITLTTRGHDRGVSRMGTVTRRLFPSAKSIEKRYTYLQDKPWLLPVAWVHRLIKTRDTWKTHAEEAQNIMSADLDEVLRIRKLCQDIGL